MEQVLYMDDRIDDDQNDGYALSKLIGNMSGKKKKNVDKRKSLEVRESVESMTGQKNRVS